MGSLADLSATSAKPFRPAPVHEGGDRDLVAWAERLAILDARRSIPDLIVRLERLLASDLDAETRYRVLRAVKRPLLEAASMIPKPLRQVDAGGAGSKCLRDGANGGPTLAVLPAPPAPLAPSGSSIRQRLYGAVARNLDWLLAELDRCELGRGPDGTERSAWVARNLVRFRERQVLCAIQEDRPWPAGLWQSLHDLFVYLVMRGRVAVRGGIEAAPVSTDATGGLDVELVYKRLVALGLAADTLGRQSIGRRTLEVIRELAADSRLVEPYRLVGEYGLVLVQVAKDSPARIRVGPLNDPFRGWVLRVPPALRALLNGLPPQAGDPMRLDESLDLAC